MGDLKDFLEQSPIAERVSLASRIVLRRLSLAPGAVDEIVDNHSFAPEGGEVCELEVGGQCIARGMIAHRRGKRFFKVAEIQEGGEE